MGSNKRAVSPYPVVPREYAGKWIVWSRDRQILFADEDLATVVDLVERGGHRGVSYEKIRPIGYLHAHLR